MVDACCIVALMALVAQGAYISQQEGMILNVLTKAWVHLPAWMQKPLHTCPICMVSVWGIPTWAIVDCTNGHLLPVYLLAAAGINEITNR